MNTAKSDFYSYIIAQKPKYRYELNLLKYEIDKRFYYYGEHFINHYESLNNIKKSSFKKVNLNIIRRIKGALKGHKKNSFTEKSIKTIVYKGYSLNANLSLKFARSNLKIERPIYENNIEYFQNLSKKLVSCDLNTLISDDFLEEIKDCKRKIYDYYNNSQYLSLIVPYDLTPFERMIIDAFKELEKKTFVYLHGLPGCYNKWDNMRADYCFVWGDEIKKNYEMIGIDPNKIKIFPNEKYSKFSSGELKFSLDHILVLSFPLPGAQSGDDVVISDRSLSIRYLYEIEFILKKFNVRKVTLKVHPSENKDWYSKFINTSFFRITNNDIMKEIKMSTLVIGPSSTCLLDSLYLGVNYVCYEPLFENKKKYDFREAVDPFNGDNEMIPVAKNIYDLEYIIKNEIKIDINVFSKYNSDQTNWDEFISLITT